MSDPRLETVVAVVARVEVAACWLARLATRAAVGGGAAGLLLWWIAIGDRAGDWWEGTAASLLVLALCLAPAAWLMNVRFALVELVELPDKLSGVTKRRAAQVRAGTLLVRPDGSLLGTLRSVRAILRDYGDVVGSWGAVAQLLVPSFWLLTVAALVAVPVVVIVAAVAALVDLAT